MLEGVADRTQLSACVTQLVDVTRQEHIIRSHRRTASIGIFTLRIHFRLSGPPTFGTADPTGVLHASVAVVNGDSKTTFSGALFGLEAISRASAAPTPRPMKIISCMALLCL